MKTPPRLFVLAVLASCFVVSTATAQWSTSPSVDNPLCTASGAQSGPRIVTDGGAGLIATWQDERVSAAESDVYAQRLNGSGVAQWAANGIAVCTATGAQSNPAAVADGSGGAIVAWTDRRAGNADVYVQRIAANGAAQWTANGVALCTLASDQQDVSVASDGAGGAIVAWRDARGAASEVYAQRVLAAGTTSWTAQGVLVASDAVNLVGPNALVDGSGGAIVLWRSELSQQLSARRISSAGALQWGAPVVLGSSILLTSPSPADADGAGGAVAAWINVGGDVYAQRVSGAGALLWGASGRVVCVASGDQVAPDIAADAGGAYVVWQDPRLPGVTRAYAQRLDGTGTPLWTPNGQELCPLSISQQAPVAVRSTSGGVIVAWKDSRGGLWGQRLDSTGGPLWAEAGVAIAQQAPGQHAGTRMLAETSGGALLAFTNAGSGLDVYAKRVNSGGGFTTAAPRGAGGTPAVALGPLTPNPLATRSLLRFALARAAAIDLAVFDAAGRRVTTLAEGPWPAGEHELRFRTAGWPRGVYFIRATVDGHSQTRRAAKVE